MFQALSSRRHRSASSRRVRANLQQIRSRRLGLEALEPRQMLSATPMTFQVVNDATTNLSYKYSDTGAPQGSTTLAAANAAPRGVASTVASDNTWVIDANRNVYVYNTSGILQGSWSAGSMPNNATPEGIATNGTDIWIVDSRSDKVFFYAGAASRLSGSQTAASSFLLNSSNRSPKDIVSDGASLWVVNDTNTDKVFKYSTSGTLAGSWTIDSANKAPTGIALDAANIGDMWIADSGTDRVYRYSAATARASGSQAAAGNFALASGNSNPQGLVVPGRPWAETPYEVEWIRQFGTPAEEGGLGVSIDGFGNVYLSGGTSGSLSVPNPTGAGTSYLAQFDTAGNTTWVHQADPIPGVDYRGVRVAADSLGNVFQAVSGGLLNYDAAGTVQWTTNLPSGESFFSVTSDDQGYAYMSSWEGSNVHVRKFDGLTGNIVWEKVLDTGGVTNSSGIEADHLGNIYVAAYTNGALIGPNAGGYDALLAKYSDAGVRLWTRQFGTPGADYAFQVAADQFGNVYTSGRTTGSLGGLNAGDEDNFLAKHDAAGNRLWIRQWGTSGQDLSSGSWVDPLGNIYRAMTTFGALGGAHKGDSDIVAVKYDPSGNLLWATQLGTAGAEISTGGIWGDDQGNIYIAGLTTGSLNGANAGGTDAVLIKLSPPAGSANGSALNSDGAGAALMFSVDSLSSGTAGTKSVSTPHRGRFVPATSPTLTVADHTRKSNNLNLLTASHLKVQRTALETDDSGRPTVSVDTAATDTAFAELDYHRWPNIVAENALAI